MQTLADLKDCSYIGVLSLSKRIIRVQSAQIRGQTYGRSRNPVFGALTSAAITPSGCLPSNIS
jgi:hypothetical protein